MLSSSTLEYKEALGILANCSQHIDLITESIKTEILPKLNSKHSMIDVGAGIGAITKNIEDYFDEVTVLDINPEVMNELSGRGYEVKIGDFFEFVSDKQYDLVLCSHVMYHLNKEQMKLFIDKLRALVSPGGYCFIALIAPRGINHDFHVKFNPNYVNSQQIIDILESEKVTFKRIHATPHHLITPHRNSMVSLLKFFLIENCLAKASDSLSATETETIEKIVSDTTDGCKQDDLYDFQQEDDYVVIQGLRRV